MENNWPLTVDELINECERLKNRYDLYTLGEKGEPLSGESEPRVDGTRYFAGEYPYGVAMIPAQWVTSVIPPYRREHDRLEDENVKLRELVKDMWHLLFDWLFKNHEVPWKEIEAAHDRLNELGIEVDA